MQSRRIVRDMESGRDGRDAGEVRKTLLIYVKHNMTTAVVKTHKPHTHALSARRSR